MTRRHLADHGSILAVALAAGLCLAACDRNSSTASNEGIAPAVGPLPEQTLAPLPPAQAPAIRPVAQAVDRYGPLEHAYYMRDTLGDLPPDYAFDYDGERPWAWRGTNRDQLLAEPADDGWREYYYRPGAVDPYLVRDRGYAYGFEGGQLLAVYDSSGRLLSDADMRRRADVAGRYLSRARALQHASLERQRADVAADQWAGRQAQFASQRDAWTQARTREPEWRAYQDAHRVQEQTYWRPEQDRRQAEAAQRARAVDSVQAETEQARRQTQVARQQTEIARQAQADAARLSKLADRERAQAVRQQADAAQKSRALQVRQAEAARKAQAEQARGQAQAARQQADAAQKAQAAQARQQDEATRHQAGEARKAQAERAGRKAEAEQRAQAVQAQKAQRRAARQAQVAARSPDDHGPKRDHEKKD